MSLGVRARPAAPRLSSSWPMLLAPITTVLTCGFASNQASATLRGAGVVLSGDRSQVIDNAETPVLV